MAMNKKLIEVALPLEEINEACIREKSIRHGHPSSLHLWWARRPLAAARAVIWSSLVDDPSSHPELFPTEEDQKRERERLFKILEDLVVWENSNNEEVLNLAKAEILKYTNNNPPALLDPFAGGGAIPLEAQRLGLEAHAHDLNPVAVMINKAMIEIPPRFAYMPPVNPSVRKKLDFSESGWKGAAGLAEDVRYYGAWLRNEAYKKVGHLYPKVELPKNVGSGKATVVAWIWARIGQCPNPNCKCDMPLVSNYAISKKKGYEAWVEPKYTEDKTLFFEVHKGICPAGKETAKMKKSALFKCPCCGEITTDAYLKDEGKAHRIKDQLMAIVAEGPKGRVYVPATIEQEIAASVDKPDNYPTGIISDNPRWFSPPAFGMTRFEDIFTNRQLLTLTTLSSLITTVQEEVEKDAIAAGMINDHINLSDGGTGAKAYSEAISIYLAFLIDQIANQSSSINGWNSINQQMISLFSRQAMPMVWDHAECNIFSNSTGSFNSLHERMIKAFSLLGFGRAGVATQFDAQTDCGLRNIMVSTDPPYYDNIGYADLSDFFYVWMRNSIKGVYPTIFKTIATPKTEELIATPNRHEGSGSKAKEFFEKGMIQTCRQLYKYSDDNIPLTIYYAYKQSDPEDKSKNTSVSSGWETMLTSIVSAGFTITGTWPIRTETVVKLKANVNALASSIVLVCRKRPADAPMTTRRNLIAELRRELKPALQKLQSSNIAPVDLAQSAIGPGMAVFSKYSKVVEADGTPMSVRSALQIINKELDVYFNEQVGELDAMSRFCVDLYTQNAFNDIKFGDADILARAKGTSVAAMASHDIVYARAGNVHLIDRTELGKMPVDRNENCIWMLTQQLTQLMATGGVVACAEAIYEMYGSNAERAKDLAYRLYTIADQKKWTQEAYAYNALVVAWPDIQSRAAMMQREKPEQLDLFSMEDAVR